MKNYFLIIIAVFSAMPSFAQVPYNGAALNGYTKRAVVSEQVGLTEVSITYHRPAVNGREGKVWGGVVHKGFADLGFGKGNPAPWRAGANENTVIEFDKDVKVGGQALPRGRYGFFIAYDPLESTIIFSKKHDAWGSFFYDEKDDALRIKVKPYALDKSIEHLKYEFTMQAPSAATVVLSWEKLAIPFKIEVDHLKQQFDAFVAESQNPRGFTSQGLIVAATWSLDNNFELEKGLEWATIAGGRKFPGDPNSFKAAITRAMILEKLGRNDESDVVIKNTLPVGAVGELQQLGRRLLQIKKPKTALEVFKYSHTKNPDQLITVVGMVRGLSGNGDFSQALQYANKALALAPDDQNKKVIQGMIDKLKAGKDVNE